MWSEAGHKWFLHTGIDNSTWWLAHIPRYNYQGEFRQERRLELLHLNICMFFFIFYLKTNSYDHSFLCSCLDHYFFLLSGDLAFRIQCKVDPDGGKSVARISLSDPDPTSANKELPDDRKSSVESKDGEVVFRPNNVKNMVKSKKSKSDELWKYLSCI